VRVRADFHVATAAAAATFLTHKIYFICLLTSLPIVAHHSTKGFGRARHSVRAALPDTSPARAE
jgi:hypothetical protein